MGMLPTKEMPFHIQHIPPLAVIISLIRPCTFHFQGDILVVRLVIILQAIIIIIVIITIISFMQGVCTNIPDTNSVRREYSVAAILLLLFMVLISLVSVLNLLYFYISTFRSMCAVPNMAVFCSSLTSCFPDMLLMYFLNDFEIAPVAPTITGITFVFTFHMRCIYIVRSLYFRMFSASYLITLIIIINVNTVHVECRNKGDTSNNRGDWDYFKVIQKIREQHTGKT